MQHPKNFKKDIQSFQWNFENIGKFDTKLSKNYRCFSNFWKNRKIVISRVLTLKKTNSRLKKQRKLKLGLELKLHNESNQNKDQFFLVKILTRQIFSEAKVFGSLGIFSELSKDFKSFKIF